jgi:hypothetical protein
MTVPPPPPMKFLCPQIQIPMPLGIENESTRTLAHAYNAYGLSRDGSLPKAFHIGKPDDAGAQHFILFPGGKQVDLSFPVTLLKPDSVVLQCFESAIGFDRKMYEDKKDAVDQKTPLARFYQDQLLEVWDPILKTKTDAAAAGQPVVYKDLLKFWDDGVGDANTSTLNLAVLQTMLDHIEHKDSYLTIHHLVANHDENVTLALAKGGLVCHAEDWGKQFYMNDQKEYKIVCARPANLAELSLAADTGVPEGSWKVTPSNFKDAAQQMKTLGLKPANLKEAGEAYEVMPPNAQGVLDATGYHKYKAISHAHLAGLLVGTAAFAVFGFVLGWRMRGRRPSGGGGSTGGVTPQRPKKPAAAAAIKDNEDPGIPRPVEKKEAPTPSPTEKKESRVVPDTTGAAPSPQAAAARTVVVADEGMEDLKAALSDVATNKSPAGGVRPSGAPSSLDITADNVIIRDPNARMPAELSRKVVMAQIAALYPKFLTDDGAAIQSNFRPGIERLADMAIQFMQKRRAEDTPTSALWDIEQTSLKSRIRGGIPVSVLREFVGQQLEKWNQANDSTMSFDAETREKMDSDATRRAGERSSYEKWIEDALRDPARLAGH